MFREDEIVMLLGAGCSVQAGIPHSTEMIEKLEALLENDGAWKEYRSIYFFLKSSLIYADGIVGKFEQNFDIERLVNVLNELEKRENSILYPFIGNWNQRLLELASYDFKILKDFRKNILEQLKKWVYLEDYKPAEYYKRLFDFKSEYNFSLRLFSLNYDLCLERTKPNHRDVERGFDGDSRVWDWKRFEPREDYQPDIYYYKLHGSIDWKRIAEEGNILKEVDNIPDYPDLIFGTDYKMQYVDPYLFYTYEFRKYSLMSKVILTIGYSFRDEHINGIITQALQNRKDRKAIIVSTDAAKIAERFPGIKGQLVPVNLEAKKFLTERLSVDEVWKLLNEKE